MNDAYLVGERERRRRAELDAWADQQEALPPESKQQYLAPLGPPASAASKPSNALVRSAASVGSAIHQGLGRGGEVAAQGFKDIGGGLLQAASPIPQASDLLGEWTARMRGIKRTVDGLFGVLLSTPAAVTGAVGAGMDPATLDQPVLDPYLSGFVRSMMGGADPKDPRKTNQPMTVREVLDLVGGALFLGGMARGKPAAPGETPPGEALARPRATPPGEVPPALPAAPERPALGAAPADRSSFNAKVTQEPAGYRVNVVTQNPEPAPTPPSPPALPTREPLALPPVPRGEIPIELGPSERWVVLDALAKEGKLEPLEQAVRDSLARREQAPPREGSAGPVPVLEAQPRDVSMTQIVDSTGRPVESTAPTMTEREYLRARERTPLSAQESATARLERLYGERLGPAGAAMEKAVAEAMKKHAAEDADFAEFSKAFDEAIQAPEITGGSGLVTPEDYLGRMYSDLQGAAPGNRTLVKGKYGRVEGVSTPSTYPAFMDELGVPRTRQNADKLMSAIDDVLAGKTEGELQQRIRAHAESMAEHENYLEETRRMFAEQDAQAAKDLGLGGEGGFASLDTVSMLSRMALGAMIGSADGDTVEERVKNGLMGMGVGALLSRRLATATVKAVSNPRVLATFRDESGVIRIPNFRVIETSEAVKKFMRDMADDEVMQKEAERQARGVRTRDETTRAGLALIKSGKFRAQKVLDAEPGTIWNAEEAAAARMLTIAAANRVVKLAADVNAGRGKLSDLDAAIALSGRMTTNTHAVMTEQGRALNALGMTVSGDVPLKISPERLAEEAAKMPRDERLPQMVLDLAEDHGVEAVGRFARFRQAVPDALLELYYGVSLLSNPMTQLRNIAGNAMAVAAAIGERQLSGMLALNPLRDPNRPHVGLGEAGQMAIAGLQTMGDAIRIAGKTAREGVNATKLDIPAREPAFTAERLGIDPSTPWGAGLDYLGKYARFNLKSLEAEDTFFKVVNFQMERRALALRQAEFEGLSGEAKANRVAELWRDPPDWLLGQAWDFAKEQTFSKDFEGRMRSLQNGLGHPLLKMTMLPFFRTPLRLAEYAAERTPVLNLVTKQFYEDIGAGGARREIALGKLGTGAAIASAVVLPTLSGDLTGNPPKDPQERKRMEEAGVKWTSIRNPLTGTYHNYGNLEPISSVMATIVDTINLLKRAPNVDDLPTEVGQAVTAAVVSAVRNLASKQYLQSVGRFLDAVQNPDTQGALKLLQKQLASWVPAIAGEAARAMDPVIRETETLLDEVKARLPFLSDELVPRRNLITGVPMERGGYLGSERSADPVLLEIARLDGAGIREPAPVLAGARPSTAPIPMEPERAGQGIPLNARQRDRLIELLTSEKAGGKTLHERLGELIGSETYRRQTDGVDGGKALLLREVYHAYVQAARARLEQEMGPAIRAHHQKRLDKLRPVPQGAAPLLETIGR